ncbi:biogenesis of lysosome-related organelles complex 1 subunit 5 isoform X1 [Zootermopsis nevadensis]|uniref:biogenesis of lysosome-related organelles complex 1 subunit 5 isoform X1 n=1 Tax=Zootermopsis nevadensis TaxID=136037 RepID=UPI000B8E2995|nr:biogenesis of lysosome-related organelles complex 1 subunit 5 isoform X1 [Zootermopsis nevadensis]
MAAVIKDVGEIWFRLFDHRPFLSGEIKFFLKEFEEKRSDREVERLFQILERSTEIKDTQIDRVKLASDIHLPTLNANLEVAVSMCNRILEKEEQHRSDTTLIARREIRKADWECFIEDMTQKCSKVDATFQEKEEELKEFYSDLEKKLLIGK